jgi:hypothetical protein
MALAAVAAFAGAAVQSATGFGFALVLSPALFAVMDPVEAVTALLVLGLALNLLVLFEGGRPEHVDWRALAPMLVAAVPGLAIGAVALLTTVGVACRDGLIPGALGRRGRLLLPTKTPPRPGYCGTIHFATITAADKQAMLINTQPGSARLLIDPAQGPRLPRLNRGSGRGTIIELFPVGSH